MHTDTPCVHKQTAITTLPAEVLYPVCPQGMHQPSMTLAVEEGIFSSTAASTEFLRAGDPKQLLRPWAVGQQLLFYLCTSNHHRVDTAPGADLSLLCSRGFPLGGIRLPPAEANSVAMSARILRVKDFSSTEKS